MEKFCTGRQTIDDNKAHPHCMLDNKDYKNTHSENVKVIAFPLLQWLHERTSMLRNTYFVYLASVCEQSLLPF